MENVELFREFLGWCVALNFGILIMATIALVGCRSFISKIHGKMLGMSDEDLSRGYFQYLAQYKIAIFVFALVPYMALCFIK